MKLNGRKSALKAPLSEIPSISDLYSNNIRDLDPRKIITEPKSTSNEITVMNLMDMNTMKYYNIR